MGEKSVIFGNVLPDVAIDEKNIEKAYKKNNDAEDNAAEAGKTWKSLQGLATGENSTKMTTNAAYVCKPQDLLCECCCNR